MNEKDYMDTMRHIRKEYIDEAMKWNGAERRRNRIIRRMTIGIGSIAAAIAVTVGVIAYGARDKHMRTANSELLQDSEQNFLGGYGEIKGYLGSGGMTVLCDRSRTYFQRNLYDVTAYSSGDNKIKFMAENCGVLTDGERLYKADGLSLSVIDSSGEKSDFFRLTEECSGYALVQNSENLFQFTNVKHLSGDYYAIAYDVPLDSSTVYHTVIYDAKQKKLVTTSALQDICAAPDGSGWYDHGITNVADSILLYRFSAPENYEAVYRRELDQNTAETISDYTVSGGKICYTLNDPSTSGFAYEQYDMQTGETKSLFRSESDTRYFIGGDTLYEVSFDGSEVVYAEMTLDGTGRKELFRAPSADLFPGESYTYRTTLPYDFIRTDSALYVSTATLGTDNLHIVRIDNATGESALLTGEPTVAPTTVPVASEGYVTPESGDLAVYYIPPEHFSSGLEDVDIYRMLPIRDAAQTNLDTDAIVNSLPLMGACWNDDFDPESTGTLTMQNIRALAAGCATYNEFDQKLQEKLTWACAWGSGIVRMEYWLDPQGKELVLTSGFGAYLLHFEENFDEGTGQYYYEFLKLGAAGSQPAVTGTTEPNRKDITEITSTTTAKSEVNNGLNDLGGHGKLRSFDATFSNIPNGFLYDDDYIYDMSTRSRLKISSGSELMMPICEKEGCQHNTPDCPQYQIDRYQVRTESRYQQTGDFSLSRINADGTATELLRIAQSANGGVFNRFTYSYVTEVSGGSTLFIRGEGERRDEQGNGNPYQEIVLLYRLSDGHVTYLTDQHAPIAICGDDNINWGLSRHAYDDDSAIWAPYYGGEHRQMLRIDAATGERTYVDVPDLNSEQWTVLNGKLWYRSSADKWVSLDLTTKEKETLCDFPEFGGIDAQFFAFEDMILLEDYETGVIYAYDHTLTRKKEVIFNDNGQTGQAYLWALRRDNHSYTGLVNIGEALFMVFSFPAFT